MIWTQRSSSFNFIFVFPYYLRPCTGTSAAEVKHRFLTQTQADLDRVFVVVVAFFLSQLTLDPVQIKKCLNKFRELFFFFLGLHPQHVEFLRLGVKLELQLWAYTTATAMQYLSCVFDLHHSSWQRQIPNPLSQARDQTRSLMGPSLIHFRCARWELLESSFESKLQNSDPRGTYLQPPDAVGSLGIFAWLLVALGGH